MKHRAFHRITQEEYDVFCDEVAQLEAEIEEWKTIRGKSTLVPTDKLKALQGKLAQLKADLKIKILLLENEQKMTAQKNERIAQLEAEIERIKEVHRLECHALECQMKNYQTEREVSDVSGK